MNFATIAVLVVVAALALLAVRRIKRKKLLFTCGGNCSACTMNCKRK